MKQKNSSKLKEKKNFRYLRKVISFWIIISLIFLGVFAVFWNFNLATFDFVYNGGYGINVAVKKVDQTKTTDKQKFKYYSGAKASAALKAKLNPLDNKVIFLKYTNKYTDNYSLTSYSVVTAQVAKNTYKSLKDFINAAQAPGFLYFLNNSGQDLLVDKSKSKASRILISDVITASIASSDKKNNNAPIITLILNPKGASSWKQVTKDNFNVWVDLAYYINAIRDVSSFQQIQALNAIRIKNHWDTQAKDIFKFSYQKNNETISRDLLQINSPKKFKEDYKYFNKWKWNIPVANLANPNDINTLSFGLNPNLAKDVGNNYIDDSIRSSLISFYKNKVINKKHRLDKYLLALDHDKSTKTNKANIISMDNLSDAKTTSNLINGSLLGINFQVVSSFVVKPLLTNVDLILALVLLLSFLLCVFGFLIYKYRVFGFLAILSIIVATTITYMLCAILFVQIGPPVILALIIIWVLLLESCINLFESYKKEHYQNNLSQIVSFKLANKKTILGTIDYHVILFIFSLILFWVGGDTLKLFSISIVVGVISSFVFSILINRIFPYLLIRFNIINKNKKSFFYIKEELLNWDFFHNLKAKLKIGKKNKKIKSIENIKVNNLNRKKILYKIKYDHFKLFLKEKRRKLFLTTVSFFVVIAAIITAIFGFNFSIATANNFDYYFHSHSTNLNIVKDNLTKIVLNFETEKNINLKFKVYELISNYQNRSNDYNLLLTTNLNSKDSSDQLNTYLQQEKNLHQISCDSFDIRYYKNHAFSFKKISLKMLIVIAATIGFIFIYISIRFNWAQFIGVVGSCLFALFLSVVLFLVFHFVITFNIILAFGGIFLYCLAISSIICERINHEKKRFNLKQFYPIFEKVNYYRRNIKALQKKKKATYQKELTEIINNKENLSNKSFKIQKKLIKEKIKQLKIINAGRLLKLKKDYQSNYQNSQLNYLKIIHKNIINDTINKIYFLMFVFGIIILILSICNLMTFSFGFLTFVGLVASLFSITFILTFLWEKLDKYNLLLRCRLRYFFKYKKFVLDEEDVEGTNI